MEPRKLAELTAAMIVANMTPEAMVPRHWQAANNAKRPTSGKDRTKIKAARKQKVKRK